MTEASNAEKNTRASARAREADTRLEIAVRAVRVPPGSLERRTPVAEVDTTIGPVLVTFVVSSLQGNKLMVRPPMKAGSADPGVGLSPAIVDAVHAAVLAAVTAHPEAGYVLRRITPPIWRNNGSGAA